MLAKNYLVIEARAETGTPAILINEIMYNPAGSDDGHEWIEIVNFSTSTDYLIDENWRFNDGANHRLTLISGDNVLNPDEYAVLATDNEIFLQGHPDFQGTLIDTVMALNNSNDSLSLSVDSGQSFFGNVAYQADWGAADNGYTLERISDSENWQQSYVLGGTPGQSNSQPSAEAINHPPQAQIIGPATGIVNQLLEFTASSTDPDGDILSYLWDLASQATSSERIVSYQFDQTGEYLIGLIVSDGNLKASTTLTVVIAEPEEEENDNTQTEVTETQNNNAQIFINEILPNPSGLDNDHEFIELFNPNNYSVDVNGWQLKDATVRRYTINTTDYPSTVIAPFGYLAVFRQKSGIALNNSDGDSVELYRPNGGLADKVFYLEAALNDQSFAKAGNSFYWTIQPTPNGLNVIKTESAAATAVQNSQNSGSSYSLSSQYVKDEIEFDAQKYQGLRINEFLPNPRGADSAEWIELYNGSSSTLNLFGFSLDDGEGGNRPYQFRASSSIPAFGFLVVPKSESGLALNNNQDKVRLISPDRQVFQEIAYENVLENHSYNYDAGEDEWFWSESATIYQTNVSLREQEQNILLQAALAEETSPPLTILQVKDLAKGEKVRLAGIVTAPPLILGKREMYLAEIDLINDLIDYSSATQIYSSSWDNFPDLKPGDVVELTGVVSESQGIKRVNLNKESQLIIIKNLPLSEPEQFAIDDLSDELIGGLIKVSGELVKKEGSNYYLADESGELKVYLKESTGIGKLDVKEGYYLEASGILTITASGYRLLPRFKADIQVGKILGESSATSSDEVIEMPASDQQKKVKKVLLISGGSLLLVFLSLLFKLKFLK